MYLWRAVDDEDKVRDLAVQRRRDKEAALQLLKRLLHNQPIEPPRFATDGLPSYGAAFNQLDLRHCTGRVGFAGTIGRRTLIFRSDDENASSSGSNPKPQRKDCSPSTPIHNTVNMPRRLISRHTPRRFRAEAATAWAAAVVDFRQGRAAFDLAQQTCQHPRRSHRISGLRTGWRRLGPARGRRNWPRATDGSTI